MRSDPNQHLPATGLPVPLDHEVGSGPQPPMDVMHDMENALDDARHLPRRNPDQQLEQAKDIGDILMKQGEF